MVSVQPSVAFRHLTNKWPERFIALTGEHEVRPYIGDCRQIVGVNLVFAQRVGALGALNAYDLSNNIIYSGKRRNFFANSPASAKKGASRSSVQVSLYTIISAVLPHNLIISL